MRSQLTGLVVMIMKHILYRLLLYWLTHTEGGSGYNNNKNNNNITDRQPS